MAAVIVCESNVRQQQVSPDSSRGEKELSSR